MLHDPWSCSLFERLVLSRLVQSQKNVTKLQHLHSWANLMALQGYNDHNDQPIHNWK
jgi:hypothetical protein